MNSATINNEKIITLDKISDLIEDLEFQYKKDKATDNVVVSQLLYAYDLKIKLLNNI